MALSASTPVPVLGSIAIEHLRAIFAQSPLPALVLSPNFTIVEANDALCISTLRIRAQLIGRPLFEAFPLNPTDPEADGEDSIRASLERAAQTLEPDIMTAQQYDIQSADGTWVRKFWSLTHGPVLDADGKLAYLVQQSQDVTEYVTSMKAGVDHRYETAELRARYEQTKLQSAARQQVLLERISADRERLESAIHAKDEFLQIVSHELKTPITTIQGNAQILAHYHDKMNEHDRQAALEDIECESLRLSRILDNLLLLARPELGGIETPEPRILNRLIKSAAQGHEHRFRRRRVIIPAETYSGAVVDCVQTYVEQILENLLSNAEKYSPSSTPITITVEQDDGMAQIRVLDAGKGFTLEQAEHVFETYFRVADERSIQAGIGIGLAVCKRLVEVMGGSIWANARPEGGAEVGFSLPLTAAADPEE